MNKKINIILASVLCSFNLMAQVDTLTIHKDKVVIDYGRKVQEWLRDVNPWALQRMAEILLEADQRGLWQAKPETKAELQKIYLSVEGELEERSDDHS